MGVTPLSPSSEKGHEATSNIIFNLAQMGIPLRDACFIEIDTYFELVDLFKNATSDSSNNPRVATQADIDMFLM